jgi:hypothetical protein
LQRRLADFARDFIAKTAMTALQLTRPFLIVQLFKPMGDIAVAHESHLLSLWEQLEIGISRA